MREGGREPGTVRAGLAEDTESAGLEMETGRCLYSSVLENTGQGTGHTGSHINHAGLGAANMEPTAVIQGFWSAQLLEERTSPS